MNQIPAPRSGTVTQILVEDGQPVEYGEPLMIIESEVNSE
jgi:acetyl-CoA carboxylase biotin carboxyl carrier protein